MKTVQMLVIGYQFWIYFGRPFSREIKKKYEQQSKINIEINQVGSSAGITALKVFPKLGCLLEI